MYQSREAQQPVPGPGGRVPGIGRWTWAVHTASTDTHLPNRLYKPLKNRDQVESGACVPPRVGVYELGLDSSVEKDGI